MPRSTTIHDKSARMSIRIWLCTSRAGQKLEVTMFYMDFQCSFCPFWQQDVWKNLA